MGRASCSTNLVSIRTVKAQVEGALMAVDGDCQYVLFKVTVPPQVLIASMFLNRLIFPIHEAYANFFQKPLTDTTNFSQDAGTAWPSTEQRTNGSWSADSGVATGWSASIKIGQWAAEIGIHRNGNPIGEIREEPPRIGRGESIVENARVDQIGTQTTEGEATFDLVIFFIGITYFKWYKSTL